MASTTNMDSTEEEKTTRTVTFGESVHKVASSTAAFTRVVSTRSMRRQVQLESDHWIVFPWTVSYKTWWGLTVLAALLTVLFETYQVAFGAAGLYPYNDASSIVEYVLSAIFVVDILIHFNTAYYNERDEIVYNRRLIAKHYGRFMFWIDLLGVFPFYAVALACAGQMGRDNTLTQYLALLRLFRLVRCYRIKQLFDILQYSTMISLMWLTLIRDFGFAIIWTHFAACVMYFIARQYDFEADRTWIGVELNGLSGFERYITALYWSVVTFTTVGYGDFSPANSAEQIWGMIYMLLNMIWAAWIIGSITLLIVKDDEKTGAYRDVLQVLDKYSTAHSFDSALTKRLRTQLKLDFSNREIADEQVLQHFPSSVRRKVLRQLYLPSLLQTHLMKGIRQHFVDAFLVNSKVEIFSPGEEILQRGSISSDLYLLVEGTVKLLPWGNNNNNNNTETTEDTNEELGSMADSEFLRSELGGSPSGTSKDLGAGDFINEIGFFTETPQINTIQTVTICKTLTMSRSAYKMIAEDHPGSAGKILQNLLTKVEEMAEETGSMPNVKLPQRLSVLRAGSIFDSSEDISAHGAEVRQTVASVQAETALTAVRDLITMHINKQKDDHTTRFLFAASRGDISTISLMCDQGFDPNSADYDSRTALMVAAMKGNIEAVTKLLEYHANPNLIDMHGSTALYEAAKNGFETTMDVLIKHGAQLCMDESQAASTLCQAVFDGDIPMLKRLLQAQIPVNAGDYDKRTAVHIAAAEGNVAALRVLVEFGADLTVKDRWNNTVQDEARRANSGQVLEYLKAVKSGNSN